MFLTSIIFAYFGTTMLFESPNTMMRYWEIPGPHWPGSSYFFFRWCAFLMCLLAIGPWFCGIDDTAMCKMWLVHNLGITAWTLYASLNKVHSLAKETWLYVGLLIFLPLTVLNAVVVYWAAREERRRKILGGSPASGASPYLRSYR